MVKVVKFCEDNHNGWGYIWTDILWPISQIGSNPEGKTALKIIFDIYIYTSSTHIEQLLFIFDETLTAI